MESNPALAPPYSKIVAVLTGDLVGSQKAHPGQVEKAMQRIEATARDLSDLADADTRFTRFRGDGWQMVIGRAGLVLQACLIIIADLRASGIGIETRISAGVGPFDTLGTANLSDASGRAFYVSGRHLDLIPKHRRMVIAGGRQSPQGDDRTGERDWQASIFDLAEWQCSSWTQAQAEAVAMALRQNLRTHQEMADRLGITRQAMQSRLAGAGFSSLETPLAAFGNLVWDDLND